MTGQLKMIKINGIISIGDMIRNAWNGAECTLSGADGIKSGKQEKFIINLVNL